jgi:hypothetical protein
MVFSLQYRYRAASPDSNEAKREREERIASPRIQFEIRTRGSGVRLLL